MGNWGAFAISLGGALAMVGCVSQLAALKILPSKHVRKVMHICTGFGFVATWPNYGPEPSAQWLAALVPMLMSVRFAAVGLGLMRDPKLVGSATRRGDPHELLGGPVLYGLIHVVCTAGWWRDSPAALVGIAALCAGDGLAEVVGRAAGAGTPRIPYNKNKSLAGSTACCLASFATALPLVAYFNFRGFFKDHLSGTEMVRGCAACAFMAAAVESLPFREIDNVTVPLAAGLLARHGGVFS